MNIHLKALLITCLIFICLGLLIYLGSTIPGFGNIIGGIIVFSLIFILVFICVEFILSQGD